MDKVPVLLKTPKNDYASLREVARIEQEYDLLKSIDDEHVIKSLGVERAQHGIALVTEDFGGQPLSRYIASRELDLEGKVNIALSVAQALGTLRREHILHKDIKPANIACNLRSG